MAVTKGGNGTKGAKEKAEKKAKLVKDEDTEDAVDVDKSAKCERARGGSSFTDETDICVDCGKVALHTQQGLKCDGCQFWHHVACEKVADDVYQFLSAHNDEPSLLWYYKKCIHTYKKMTGMMLALQEHHLQLEEKVKELTTSVSRKFDDLAKDLAKKLDDRDNGQKKSEESSQAQVEEKFDTFMDKVMQKIDLKEDVGTAVSTKLKEEQEESEEIRKRRTNVIIHGLRESTIDSAEGRMKADEDELTNLLHEVGCDDVSVGSIVRLGKRDDDPVNKPRVLKVVMASEQQKDKILRQAKTCEAGRRTGERKYSSIRT
jgi:hypothetical protein